MNSLRFQHRVLRTAAAAIVAGMVFQFGALSGCNDRLVGLTTFIDPCGTFLANCTPGSFQTNNADIGDFCIDPTCTIPGQCGMPGTQPIGTIRNICP